MITDFLKTSRPKEDLKTALEVLLEFKACETTEELVAIALIAWVKLEQYEEFLSHLVEATPLRSDTLHYMKRTAKDAY